MPSLGLKSQDTGYDQISVMGLAKSLDQLIRTGSLEEPSRLLVTGVKDIQKRFLIVFLSSGAKYLEKMHNCVSLSSYTTGNESKDHK